MQIIIQSNQTLQIINNMFSQQSTIFPKQIKLDDYQPYENNSLIILESSNLLLGSGSRTSTAAIVLVKALHYLIDQGELQLKAKNIIQIGSGIGLVGIYLSALGANVILCDTPALKDLAEKNININRKMIRGKLEYCIGSWKKTKCLGNCKQSLQSQTISTSSSDKFRQSCLYHLVQSCDLSLVCQCGGMNDLQCQLKLMGKDGMFLAFMKRQNWDEGLDQRTLEEYLNQNNYQYEKINSYHPDYVDKRISIMRIYPLNKVQQQKRQKKQKINTEQEMLQKQQQQSMNTKMGKLEIQQSNYINIQRTKQDSSKIIQQKEMSN